MQEDSARQFALTWSGRGDENRECYAFWFSLLRDVFGVDKPENILKPQEPVHFDHSTGYIDILIPSAKVLIEQKSFGKSLDKIYKQADGEYRTPFEQAKRYADALPYSLRPRWIITCNFAEFRIYDLAQMDSLEYLTATKIYVPTILKLEDFRNDFNRLKFIVAPNADIKPEIKIATDAAKIVRKICAALDKDYAKRDENYINALSKLCARLVFCFYADDAHLFTEAKFGDYLKNFSHNQLRDALQKFFDALNTPIENRTELKNFPYVNGGLFEEKIAIPPLNQAFKFEIEYAHILKFGFNENVKFSWRELDATIFGAMFESIFNPATRRSNGIHYTAAENIHKVIDPLFLDDLSAELLNIKRMQKKNRVDALKAFQDKLASLNFLDPACGSGNFLTETYLSLRRLENEVLSELKNLFADLPDNPVKVTPHQFYGIEINDSAVTAANVALQIAEIQMLRKTSWILGRELKELPLSKYISIRKANALRVDWREICPRVDFIIGNPPFVGARMKSAEQARDIQKIFAGWKNLGNLDYVACWYKKAADLMANNTIRAALISTNSICQGESIGALWKNLFAAGNHIDFAHRTFKWISDSENMASVYCVVVGFSSAPNDKPKIIYDGDKKNVAENINAYLIDGADIFVESHASHIQEGVPPIGIGNKPIDDGNYLFTPDEMEEFIKREPASEKYFRPWYGSREFIQGKRRYCLWLGDLSEAEIKKMPLCWERVENVRRYRLASKSPGTRKFADKPTRFHVENFPGGNYLAIPKISSGTRRYIPIGFMDETVICADSLKLVPNATLYHFGVLTSSIHMAWTRTTTCTLGTGLDYSNNIVYNNFVWCAPSARQKSLIEETAQKILDVRADFSDWTLAKLYDEATMPVELRVAHKANDYAVALAYGFEEFWEDEPRVVAELMKRYKVISDNLR